VFGFLLAITEVNAFLDLRYFPFANVTIDGCPILLKFCRILAWQLINNSWIVEEERAEAEARIGTVHRILTAPKHAKKYQRCKWECTAAAPLSAVQVPWGMQQKGQNLLRLLSRSVAVLQLFSSSYQKC
jgi:hypothetical protein